MASFQPSCSPHRAVAESPHRAVERLHPYLVTITASLSSAQQGQKILFTINAVHPPQIGLSLWLCNLNHRTDIAYHDFHFQLDPNGYSASIENVFDVTIEDTIYQCANPFGPQIYSNGISMSISAAPATATAPELQRWWDSYLVPVRGYDGTVTGVLPENPAYAVGGSIYAVGPSGTADFDHAAFDGAGINNFVDNTIPGYPLSMYFLVKSVFLANDIEAIFVKSNDAMGPNYPLGLWNNTFDGIGGAPLTCSVV